jgi:hypothetical protein
MVESRSKTEPLSETAKTHLIDVYVANRYGRQEDIQNRYVEKGLAVEEDSITLYSRVKKEFFKKNEDHLKNEWIKGTPDLYTGETIQNAETIIDIKSSWDIYTFMRTLTKDVNKLYYWQLQGYMDLTGAKSATLAYCLVDTPLQIIADEKRRLMWKMGVATEETPLFVEACEALDAAMTFGDIPIHERLIEFEIKRNDIDIMKMHTRVEECRKWLNEFENSRLCQIAMEQN